MVGWSGDGGMVRARQNEGMSTDTSYCSAQILQHTGCTLIARAQHTHRTCCGRRWRSGQCATTTTTSCCSQPPSRGPPCVAGTSSGRCICAVCRHKR